MFNVFQYDRERQTQTQEQKFRRSQSTLQHHKKQKNSILVQNYNARVEQFLKTTMTHPIIYQNYIPPFQIVPRPSDPSKFKGGVSFMTKGCKTEKQRVKEAVDSNKILDTIPTNSNIKNTNPKIHRYLVRKSEPVNTIHKFPVLNIRSQESESSESEEQSGSSSAGRGNRDKRSSLSPSGDLKKTHFKALMQKLVHDSEFVEMDKKKSNALRNFPARTRQPLLALIQFTNSRLRCMRRPLSRQVLENCNVIMPKAKRRFLRKGQGHLMVDS